jgi:methylmalonyl-CoA mutase
MSDTTQIRAQWEAKAGEELGGRPLQSLVRHTADGIEIAPLYLRDAATGTTAGLPGQFPGVRGRTDRGAGIGHGWMSVQEYRHADARAADAPARRDLALGLDGLRFIIDSELRAGRAAATNPDGLVCDPDDELATLLDGIDPTRTLLWFDAGLLAPRWADAFERWLDDSHDSDGPEPATLGRGPSHGGVIYDPFSALAGTGSLACDIEAAFAGTQDAMLGMRAGLLGISTAVYHDAGASEADELALAL